MQLNSTNGKACQRTRVGTFANPAELPVGPGDLEKLGRWLPRNKTELLIEIRGRVQCDPDLMRPSLLLCWAYAERVTRMLDQDPFPGVTRKITNQLQKLGVKNGL